MDGLTPEQAGALFRADHLAFGASVEIGPGILAKNQTLGGLGLDAVSLVTVVVSTATSVGAGVLGNALYDWLKGRLGKVELNGKTVAVEPEALAQALRAQESEPDGES